MENASESRKAIYLDYNATTPVDRRVREAMTPYWEECYGNPGSAHPKGGEAARAVENSRREVAGLLACDPEQVCFTGCATEANNLVIKGVAFANEARGRHIIISAIEHPSVREPAIWLRNRGFLLDELPVDGAGRVDPDDLKKALRPDTILVSVMHANNETGTIQPVEEIAALCREAQVLFHCDCSQSAGKIPVDLKKLGADLATFAGHKIYAPKGVGLLVRSPDVSMEALLHGGGQEKGLRGGTENVAFMVAVGRAFQVAGSLMEAESPRQKRLRDRLHQILAEEGGVLNGHEEKRLPNTLNISFPGLRGSDILAGAPELMAGTGAACHGREVKLSAVLSAMGIDAHRGMGAIRLTLGRGTGEEDIERAGRALVRSIRLTKAAEKTAPKTAAKQAPRPRKRKRPAWPQDRIDRFSGDGEEMMFFPDDEKEEEK